MHLLRFALITIALLVANSGAVAEALWQKTATGMTPKQVQKLYPSASKPWLADGQLVMRLKHVTLFDEEFTALFYFNSGKLAKVALLAGLSADKSDFTKRPMLATFMLIRDELTKKYGKPVSSESAMGFPSVSFIHDDTSIRLSAIDMTRYGKDTQSISISYEAISGGNAPL